MRTIFLNVRSSLLLVAVCFALAACGDGGGESAASTNGGGGSASLTISGSPPSQIVVGTQFSFTPTVTNPNGGALTFTGNNLPSWVNLNPATGNLSGTVTAGDVGTYSNISVTVSNGSENATTASFTIGVVASGPGSATLTWMPPTSYTDNSPLVVDHYNVYVAATPGALGGATPIAISGGLSAYVVDQLASGQTWYFSITAVDASGVESTFSNTASKAL